MAEKTIVKESEKSEQTVSDEALAQYLSLPVIEQQLKELDSMIKQTDEELSLARRAMVDEDYSEDKWNGAYYGEYTSIASAFFNSKIATLLQMLTIEANKNCFENKHIPVYCMESMLYLLELCKVNPHAMLSGEYAGGGIMKQVPILIIDRKQ